LESCALRGGERLLNHHGLLRAPLFKVNSEPLLELLNLFISGRLEDHSLPVPTFRRFKQALSFLMCEADPPNEILVFEAVQKPHNVGATESAFCKQIGKVLSQYDRLALFVKHSGLSEMKHDNPLPNADIALLRNLVQPWEQVGDRVKKHLW
jgi:hypothetical protein